jgi:radical SAM protein with 4Fe4S-binding SPASM domain
MGDEMLIQASDVIYEIYFQHAQVEITGHCNMKCQHCRAWEEANVHMPVDVVKKIVDFSVANTDDVGKFALTISGGEPFLHPQLTDIVRMTKESGIEDALITTNGSPVTDARLKKLEDVGMKNLAIQVSIDSVDPQTHDTFRGFKNAHIKAVDALRRTARTGLTASLKATITPATLHEMEDLVRLAIDSGAVRVGMGSVIPTGRGRENQHLALSSEQKKEFLYKLAEYKQKYPHIDITTEDPLKFAVPGGCWSYGGGDYTDEAFFGGCSAGTTSFNVSSEGIMTPCAVLLKPIVNVSDKSVKEIEEAYVNSPVVKSLISREFKDNCGMCKMKRLCGGCRAVAEGVYGDFMRGDTTCWKKAASSNLCL